MTVSVMPRGSAARITVAALCALLSVVGSDATAQADTPKEILILNSYHHEFQWTKDQTLAARETLTEGIENLELYVEYMDTKRIYNEEYLDHLHNMLKLKYENTKFDAIITTDDNALHFAIEHHKDIFGEAPVCFCGINAYDESLLTDRPQFTGLVEVLDIKATIDLAVKLHPGTEKVVVVVDDTPTGLGQERDVAAVARQYENLDFEFLRGGELSNAELIDRLSALPNNSIVLLTVWLRDKTGTYCPPDVQGPLISSASSVPVYGIIDMYLGHGIVGGKLLDSRTQGRMAAEMALRIIDGKKPADIPVIVKSTNPYMFDYEQLQRWRISMSDLPSDSAVVNKPFCLYDEYKLLIWSVSGLVVFLAATVLVLVLNTARRKRAEEAILESEDRFRRLFENAPLGYQSLDANGNIIELNDTWCKLLGYTKEEVFGRNFSEFIHPDFRKHFKERFPKFKSMGYILGAEFEMIKKDGSEIIVAFDGKIGHHDDGSFKQTHCVLSDITERKRVEEALLSEKLLSDEYINSLPGLFYVFDEQRFVRWNREWERVTGYSAEELGAMYGTDFFEGEDQTLIEERMRKVFREGASEAEVELVTKDGRRIPYYFTGLRKVFDGKDHLVGLGIDVTDRRRAQREREELIAKLETQNAELERFTYTVSHDLKSPLITIKGYIGLLQQSLTQGSSEEMGDDLARVSNAADKMDQLLKDLLELSRIGRLVNPLEDVPLGELAAEALQLVAGQIEQRSVQVEISPNLPVVFGDRLRLLEVVQNLIDNAVKYMGDQSQPRVEIGSRRDGHETVCYVRDNGIGIEPRYHEKVFGLFDQLDQKAEGSGIGLALVKRIVEVHGGRAWVESEGSGYGSTFCFTIAEKDSAGT